MFESPRARKVKPLVEAVSVCMRLPDLATASAMGAILGSHSPSESWCRGSCDGLAQGHLHEKGQIDLLTVLQRKGPRQGFSP